MVRGINPYYNIKTKMKEQTVKNILDTKSPQYIADNVDAILTLIDLETAAALSKLK